MNSSHTLMGLAHLACQAQRPIGLPQRPIEVSELELATYSGRARKLVTATIVAAMVVDGGAWWCREHQGGVGNPFWGFTRVKEVRVRVSGSGGARSKQGNGAAALRPSSCQSGQCLSTSGPRGVQWWWRWSSGWLVAAWTVGSSASTHGDNNLGAAAMVLELKDKFAGSRRSSW